MLSRLIARIRTKPWKDARASYGPEPYRRAEQVDVAERVEAVLEGSTKYLLRDVIGLDALKALPAACIPSRFVKELPVTAAEVAEYVVQRGLPRGFFQGKFWLKITKNGEGWKVVIRDERGGLEFDQTYETKSGAELAALGECWWGCQRYVVGSLE